MPRAKKTTTVVELEQSVLDSVLYATETHAAARTMGVGSSVMGEIKPGMTLTKLPAGKRRVIHVNPANIYENKNGYNAKKRRSPELPTVVIIDGGNKRHFHAVVITGPVALTPLSGDEANSAAVGLITHGEIEAYVDPNGDKKVIQASGCGYNTYK
jgi:hypothetical protein